MCNTILIPPNNTDELIQFINFINNTRDNTLPELAKQTVEILSCEMFLLDYMKFTAEEMKSNTKTFQWVKHSYELILSSQHTIKKCSTQFKNTLLKNINIFNTKLKNYESELYDYPQLGNINDIHMYAKKSQDLDSKLTAALKSIDEFNRLENYYGLSESVYPLRKMVNTLI